MLSLPQPRPTVFGILPDGAAGIRATLRIMVQLTRAWKKSPSINALACELVKDLPQGDKNAEVQALQEFVRDNIRYTNDTTSVETLRTPQATLEMAVGDCDDKALLLATLLESIGRSTRFCAACLVDGQWHVMCQVRIGSKWYTLETIVNVDAGWHPSGVVRQIVAHN
jgi:predicted transglutaminase-like cysteine proteinase